MTTQVHVEEPAAASARIGTAREPRRGTTRRLARHDVLAARLAELFGIRSVMQAAAEVVTEGWVQHAWFAYRDEAGRTRLATAHDLRLMGGRPVVGACLVGAVVEAGGGVPAAHSQLVARSLDLTWHTLSEDPGRPVRWCPSPQERAAQVRELTRWNDAASRTSEDVTTLLHATSQAVLVEVGRTRREQSRL